MGHSGCYIVVMLLCGVKVRVPCASAGDPCATAAYQSYVNTHPIGGPHASSRSDWLGHGCPVLARSARRHRRPTARRNSHGSARLSLGGRSLQLRNSQERVLRYRQYVHRLPAPAVASAGPAPRKGCRPGAPGIPSDPSPPETSQYRPTPHASMRVHPAVLAALVWPLASGCSTSKDYSDRQPPPRPPEAPLLGSPDSIVDGISIARVSVADSSDVPMRALRTAGSILLEANPGVVSPDIRDVAASGDTVFVLDGSGPAIEAFRRSGRRLWRADNASAGLELDEPQRLTLYHDSLYVADVGNGGHVAILTVDGRLARQVHIDTDRGIWSLAVTRNRLFASLVDPEDGDSSMSLVLAADRTGRILGRGCRRHPLMVVSIARGDLLNVARLTNVWTDGSSAFCQQMISPVVQILDSAGRLDRRRERCPAVLPETGGRTGDHQ